MNKIASVAFSLLMMLSVMNVAAAESTIVLDDIKTFTHGNLGSVSGHVSNVVAGSVVNITVLYPGKSFSDLTITPNLLTSADNEIAFLGTTQTNAAGKFFINFKLEGISASQDDAYTVVADGATKSATAPLHFINHNDMQDLTALIAAKSPQQLASTNNYALVQLLGERKYPSIFTNAMKQEVVGTLKAEPALSADNLAQSIDKAVVLSVTKSFRPTTAQQLKEGYDFILYYGSETGANSGGEVFSALTEKGKSVLAKRVFSGQSFTKPSQVGEFIDDCSLAALFAGGSLGTQGKLADLTAGEEVGKLLCKDANVESAYQRFISNPDKRMSIISSLLSGINDESTSQQVRDAFKDSVDKAFNTSPSQGGSSGGAGGSGGSGGGLGASGGLSGGTSKVVSTVPESGIAVEDVSTAAFSDIDGVPWAAEAINALSRLGVVKGDGTGAFNPNVGITREEFVKIIVETFSIELDTSGTPQFEDVEPNQWYAPYIYAAHQKGVINGTSDRLFGTGALISRQDIAAICYRTTRLLELRMNSVAEYSQFHDFNEIAPYAREAVAFLQQAGVVKGMGEGIFMPCANATRAEAAVMVYSLFSNITKGDAE